MGRVAPAIPLGRTAATIAELCLALQCGLFLRRLSDITGMPLFQMGGYAFVPLAILAELVCWHAVLSLNPYPLTECQMARFSRSSGAASGDLHDRSSGGVDDAERMPTVESDIHLVARWTETQTAWRGR